MMTPEETARELAAAILEWGGCFDCCGDSGAAFDKIHPDPEVRWADERIVEALLNLVRQAQAEVLADAAHALEGDTHIPDHRSGRAAIQFLRDRADRIEGRDEP